MPMLSKSLSTKARRRVSARNVFRPNGRTQRKFTGRIIGHFRRLGANAWDDYEFVAEDLGEASVFPTVKIQLEDKGTRFRMRKRGLVKVLEWVPTAEEHAEIGDNADLRRGVFVRDYVASAPNKAGIGVSGFIAKTLNT